jgi:hypothetical protein
MRPSWLPAVPVLVLALATSAYAYVLVQDSPTTAPRHWPESTQPILIEINDQTSDSLPNVTAGSDPLGAIERALDVWPAVADVRFERGTTSIATGGMDGSNILTLVDTPANRQAIEMAGGPVGLTLTFFQDADLIEADILFNPGLVFTTTLDGDGELAGAGLQDIEATAVHELGHFIGLHHTGVEAASMWALVSVLQRDLSADDLAGARRLYPVSGAGTIRGNVSVGGAAAFGAQVVALASDGTVAASALSLPDGTFAIEALPPDTYTVYVEPLDGPHASVPSVPCVRVANLNGAGLFNAATLTTDFATMFLGGNGSPAAISLQAGSVETGNFNLPAGEGGLPNPTLIGPAMLDGGSLTAQVRTGPLPLREGAQLIAVAGPGLDTVSADEIGFSGDDIEVNPSSLQMLAGSCGDDPLPFIVFEVTVAAGAASGARSLLLRLGDSVRAMTGAVDIVAAEAPATPTPVVTPTPPPGGCVGDCGGDDAVTVDEVLTMVNIALGNVGIGQCLAGDGNGDLQITVDEILTAVNNALSGCG